jgi:hypothetical protein
MISARLIQIHKTFSCLFETFMCTIMFDVFLTNFLTPMHGTLVIILSKYLYIY